MRTIWRLQICIDGVFFQTEDTLDECLTWWLRRVRSIEPWTAGTQIELISLKELYVVKEAMPE